MLARPQPGAAPGVYFEWLSPPSAIRGVRSDIAAFVGIAARGPLHRPVRIETWAQFTSTFGAHVPQGYLAYAVEGFFANGGLTCWVVRVADESKAVVTNLAVANALDLPALDLRAASPGGWSRRLAVTVTRTAADRFSLVVALPHGARESWHDLTLAPQSQRFVERVLNDEARGSQLVRARVVVPASGESETTWEARIKDTPTTQKVFGVDGTGGDATNDPDGLATLRLEHLIGSEEKRRGLATLDEIDEIGIVAIPDLLPKLPFAGATKWRPRRCGNLEAEEPAAYVEPEPIFPPALSDNDVALGQIAMVTQCERLKDRFALLDPPLSLRSAEEAITWRRQFTSSYGAIYFPTLRVPDPLRIDGLLRAVPPCGHVAGVYARGDHRVGVHKPPANERLEAASDVIVAFGDVEHGHLNSAGVNVIRPVGGRGLRVMGARTLASADQEWRYVNVRRLLMMIEESIDEQTQWMVFEPNDRALWRDTDRVVRAFLDDLWRRGMLDGATAEDAYFVRCDETTNPAEQTARGLMVCEVGVQPPWPAEFVVVRIGRTDAGTEITEGRGSSHG